MNRRKLERLIQEMADGTLSDQEISLLDAELLANSDSREFYRQSMQIEVLMSEAVQIGTPTGTIASTQAVTHHQRRRSTIYFLTIAAALVALFIITKSLISPAPPTPKTKSTVAQMKVIFSPGTSWSGIVSEEGMVNAGAGIVIQFGFAKLQLPGDVTAIIEGPASFRLSEHDLLILQEGGAWFKAGQAGHHLRVQTPSIQVLNQGAEFGIFTCLDDKDIVEVFEGQVTCRARFSIKESVTLKAGESNQVSPVGRWVEQPAGKHCFIKTLPSQLPGTLFSFDAEAPLRPKIAYAPGREMRVRTRGGKPANLHEGIKGPSLLIKSPDHTLVTDWKGFKGSRPRTIAGWIYPNKDSDKRRSVLISWGHLTKKNPSRCMVMLHRPDGQKDKYLRLSFGNSVNFTGSTPIIPEQWQHFAVVYRGMERGDGEMVTLYINGKREKIDLQLSGNPQDDHPIYTIVDDPHSTPLNIGCASYPHGPRGLYYGQIDELWIIPRALSAEQVIDLMQGSTQEPLSR